MDTKKKSYWKGIEQLTNQPEFVKNNEKEFPEFLPIKDAHGDNSEEGLNTNRRDFLKLMGFSVAAVSLAACETPVKKAIPYLNKPEDIDPGIPNYYASSFAMGSDYCPILVKTREGRPIHVEGNSFSSFSQGSVNARVVASIMSLYDETRAKSAGEIKKADASLDAKDWSNTDEKIKAQLSTVAGEGGTIYIVTNTNISPTTHQIFADFKAKYPTAKVVTYDQESVNGLVAAHGGTLPTFHFDKADVIVSINADFLGNWISSVEISPDYTKTRKVGKDKKNMSRHYQFETMMSITGGSADYRRPIKPSQEGLVVAGLYNAISGGAVGVDLPKEVVADLERAAKDLMNAKGKSLVVSGSNDQAVQVLVHSINELLTNHGATIDSNDASYLRQGNDKAMADFASNLSGNDAVIFVNTNPVYDHPMGADLAKKIAGAKLSVSTADRIDETAVNCMYLCPDNHYLESWGDFEPKKGLYSLGQPTIRNIFNTRQVQDSFLSWMEAGTSYKDYLMKFWEEKYFPMQSEESSFVKFWQRSLHDGVFEPKSATSLLGQMMAVAAPAEGEEAPAGMDASAALSSVTSTYTNTKGIELSVYSAGVIGWGEHSNNPYIHETPDPITRVCWGNYVAVSPKWAKDNNVEIFEVKTNEAKITVNGKEVNLPIMIQPGLEANTIAIPVGFGRAKSVGKVAEEAGGENAYPLASTVNGMVNFSTFSGVKIENTGKVVELAQTQTHHTIMGRKTIIQETKLDFYKANKWDEDKNLVLIHTSDGVKKPEELSLWDVKTDGYSDKDPREVKADKLQGKEETPVIGDILWNEKLGLKADTHKYPLHHWGMSIDLNSCYGCGACVVACHTENNVPIVGKQEVINRREMHWLRIDRYYSSTKESIKTHNYDEMEEPADNPEVVFQPMMCQHCNNAPCETVCPVAATTHSSEGLNQMTYNRCVGTKYCANNCPYKVRRFNWFKYNNNDEFDYHMNNNLGKMVLNPDVTVRSRGVMEKCSMCVQRIQAGKLEAKRQGRKVQDGEVKTACSAACAAGAITFGDFNDEKSEIRELMNHEVDDRGYNVLSEINVRPNVWYLSKIRNQELTEEEKKRLS